MCQFTMYAMYDKVLLKYKFEDKERENMLLKCDIAFMEWKNIRIRDISQNSSRIEVPPEEMLSIYCLIRDDKRRNKQNSDSFFFCHTFFTRLQIVVVYGNAWAYNNFWMYRDNLGNLYSKCFFFFRAFLHFWNITRKKIQIVL